MALATPARSLGSPSDAFFLLILQENRRQKGCLWKSSLLAHLYHGLDNVVSSGGVNNYATAARWKVLLSESGFACSVLHNIAGMY
jgi:hypothetical protein